MSDFTPGTVQEVYVFYRTDCCTTELDIRGTDAQGNVGKCPKIDMGPVGGEDRRMESDTGRARGGEGERE